MRIHVSPETQALLEKTNPGGFKMLPRGPVEMKGKGRIPTYWLEGEQFGLDDSSVGIIYFVSKSQQAVVFHYSFFR